MSDLITGISGNNMNNVLPEDRLYTVFHFECDKHLETMLNVASEDGWHIQHLHFNRTRKGGRIIAWMRRAPA